MKGKFGWIFGALDTVVGFILLVAAQMEISSNPWYTWRKPYTSYEAQVLMVKWVGILLIVCGLIWLGLKVYQTRYTSNHIQEINPITKTGGAIQCPNCGLTLSAGVGQCPRCGNPVNAHKLPSNPVQGAPSHYCSNCGSQVGESQSFCAKCGHKISK